MERKTDSASVTNGASAFAARKALSKRIRFEIFKRDGFKCLYCGATPVQKVLRVDHVTPVVAGGSDDPTNLVTSCFDCNAGKGPVPLEERKLVAGFASEAEKEHAEQIREWLKIQREINSARQEVASEFADAWEEQMGPMTQDMANRLSLLAKEWPAAKLIEAMEITARKFGPPENGEYEYRYALKQQKYFHGILRRWREEAAPPPQPVAPRWSARALRVERHLAAWNKAAPESATLDDIFKEFALASWGSPQAIEIAEYTTEWEGGTECKCRGLVLRTKAVPNSTRVSFWVEDDPEASVAVDLLDEIHSADGTAAFLWHVHSNPDQYANPVTKEEVSTANRELSASISEAREFLLYLQTGDEKPLRACRDHYGWRSPTWLAD